MLFKIKLLISFVFFLTFSFNAQKPSTTRVVEVQSEREISQKDMNLLSYRIVELSNKTRALSEDQQHLMHKKINICLDQLLLEVSLPKLFFSKCPKDRVADYTNKFYTDMFHVYECAREAYNNINE